MLANAGHLYYSLDRSTRYVSDSPSLRELTACKDSCLQMKHLYKGLHFRVHNELMQFHRLILRQTSTDIKYFVGECEWSRTYKDNSFQRWQNLPKKDTRWQKYSLQCDNPQLKLSERLVKSLKLTRTHSDFLYYDTGKFVNRQPFDDLPGLFKRVASMQSSLVRS